MKSRLFFTVPAFVLIASLLPWGSAFAWRHPSPVRMIDPIVSTEWLDDNSADVVIIDIRDPDSYTAGHIPGSINEPFVTGFDPVTGPSSKWIVASEDGLWLQVPADADLIDAIGSLGITQDSRVVVVTAPNPGEPPHYGLSNGTRVASTLIYAGIVNVAILDGGYPKWMEDGYPIDTAVPVVTPVAYEGTFNKRMFVSIGYVRRHLWRADIIDARDADVYFGVTIEPFADKAGHIPGAASLPAPWIWDLNEDGTYTFKDPEILEAMADGVHRERCYRGAKSIVYCGVGGYASAWWFVLTQILGYQNVKFYDGASQEWVRHYDMVPFQWD
jgi:thiosulfate/3-mercaptopyruvate sulfurtransferase